MATTDSRKRAALADDFSQKHRPGKKIKSSGRLHGSSNFPPEFWDNLSKVPLALRALRELDRRNSSRPAPRLTAPAVYATDCARFARHGGPDLRHLRGHCEPAGPVHHPMASSYSSASSNGQTKSTKSTDTADVAAKPKRASPYDAVFEQHAIDHGIYPEGYDYPGDRQTPEPENIDELRLEFAAARDSPSLSQFSGSAFRTFKQKNKTVSEGSLKRSVIPMIAGNSDIPNDGDLQFTNTESIIGRATTRAVPDFFDGARAGDIHKKVRDAEEEGNLNSLIIPTKHAGAPVAPNFFLEVKAPMASGAVALRQVMQDGAIGARAMHALQNYGAEEPVFDGNAYTYSSTYHAGTLKLYAHHITPPTASGGRPEYHMTQVKGVDMTNDRDAFLQGATAFRNARDVAQRVRDGFIQAANARARQSDVEAPPGAKTAVAAAEQLDSEESSDDFVDCEEHPESQAAGTEDHAASGDVDEEPALAQPPEDEEPGQESASPAAEAAADKSPATSPASSFTGSRSQTGSKRARAPHSPPPNSQPRKKHHRPKGKNARRSAPPRADGSSAQGSD